MASRAIKNETTSVAISVRAAVQGPARSHKPRSRHNLLLHTAPVSTLQFRPPEVSTHSVSVTQRVMHGPERNMPLSVPRLSRSVNQPRSALQQQHVKIRERIDRLATALGPAGPSPPSASLSADATRPYHRTYASARTFVEGTHDSPSAVPDRRCFPPGAPSPARTRPFASESASEFTAPAARLLQRGRHIRRIVHDVAGKNRPVRQALLSLNCLNRRAVVGHNGRSLRWSATIPIDFLRHPPAGSSVTPPRYALSARAVSTQQSPLPVWNSCHRTAIPNPAFPLPRIGSSRFSISPVCSP